MELSLSLLWFGNSLRLSSSSQEEHAECSSILSTVLLYRVFPPEPEMGLQILPWLRNICENQRQLLSFPSSSGLFKTKTTFTAALLMEM